MKPLTRAQSLMCQEFYLGKNLVAYGSAGTGKTYVALSLAFEEITKPRSLVKKVIVVRSAVATREVGFLPGNLEEKMAVYEMPYIELGLGYAEYKKAGRVQFLSTSYLRSMTWDKSIVIVDEAQNMTAHEINSVATRLGQNSRIIFLGDTAQTDLKQSGFEKLVRVASKIPEFALVEFTRDDIVRSAFVRSWLIAWEDDV